MDTFKCWKQQQPLKICWHNTQRKLYNEHKGKKLYIKIGWKVNATQKTPFLIPRLETDRSRI